jgi:hypothetical protein
VLISITVISLFRGQDRDHRLSRHIGSEVSDALNV